MAIIRKIEAKTPSDLFRLDGTIKKKRVAAYARVSTEQEEQQSSYETQVKYYTNYIKNNPDWEFVGIYSDEGISGTNTKKRDGFKRMITDALNGNIDLILTKSISRFARNTVDSLVTIRKLKEKGIEVYFEKENIYSLDSKGELMLTIMSSIAQEESRSISENVTWGKRKSMADGKVSIVRKGFLGYKLDEGGNIVIDDVEAEIIRNIYSLFLNGKTIREICAYLESIGVCAPRGSKKWSVSTVKSILGNEKYKGDALLQKSYSSDFLNKKRKKNNGELPQYYVEGSHPAIISPEVFDLVQAELKTRGLSKNSRTGYLSSRIICGDCGCYYGRKTRKQKNGGRINYWYCNQKYAGECICTTPTVLEEDIERAFIDGVNSVIKDKQLYFDKITSRLEALNNTSEIEENIGALQVRLEDVVSRIRALIEANSMVAQDQDDYSKEFEKLNSTRLKLENEINSLENSLQEKLNQQKQIEIFISELKRHDSLIQDFDEELWSALVKSITVLTDKGMVLEFKDGTKINL